MHSDKIDKQLAKYLSPTYKSMLVRSERITFKNLQVLRSNCKKRLSENYTFSFFKPSSCGEKLVSFKMILLMVSICSSFVVFGSALTPEETVDKIGKMIIFRNLYKPKEIELFKEYVLETRREYSDDEEIRARMGYFKDHLRLKAGAEPQYCPRTDFSDRSPKEILQRTGYVPVGNMSERIAADAPYIEALLNNFTEPLPESFDWREKNVLDKVKQQGQCGSCWAFAFMAMVEAQVAKHIKQPVTLSKSQLVECDKIDGGCDGGNVDGAWKYITGNGYETEEDYPYRNGGGIENNCTHDEGKSFLHMKENSDPHLVGISKVKPVHLIGSIKKHFEGAEQIKRVLVNHGPVAVSIKAYYLGSKFNHDFTKVLNIDPYCCSLMKTNHLVVIVGYGVEDGKDYWIVRNSWGEHWGDNGHVKLERGINICGIEDDATIIITKPVKN